MVRSTPPSKPMLCLLAALTSMARGMRSFLVRPREWMMSNPPTNIWAPESAMLILVMDLFAALGRGSSSSLYPDVHRLIDT